MRRPKLFLFGGAVLLWALCWILAFIFISGKSSDLPSNSNVDYWARRGQFGDLFGAVNALFSGLAFGGIIYTIFLQKQELQLQRRELAETRKEFQVQNRTLKRQRFETTFFNLLNFHLELVKPLIKDGSLHIPVNEFHSLLSESSMLIFEEAKTNEYKNVFRSLIKSHIPKVSGYLQSLIAIYNAIHLYSKSDRIRKRYYDILVAYISLTEKIFLFYYAALYKENEGLVDTLRKMEREMKFLRIRQSNFPHPSFRNMHKLIFESKEDTSST